MALNRGYGQPSPWQSGAPPGQGQVMSGLMTATGYPQQQAFGPQSFAPNPAGYLNQSGINWNMGANVPNGQLRMGQQQGWQQQGLIAGGNQRTNQRGPNKRNANWNNNNDNHQVKRQNKGPNAQNNRNQGNKGNQNRNNNITRGNQNRNFVNRNLNQKNRKQGQRGKVHHHAQRTAQNLTKKEYPIKKAVNTDKTKNDDFESIQGHYIVPVFGYCCKLCDVFLKDKNARNEHAKQEDHLEKFKVAEEEKKAKKLAKAKNGEDKSGDKTEQANGDATNENDENDEQNGDEENDVENEEEEVDDANTTENGNEDDQEDVDDADAQADSSEVTEDSKNLQQSIQQDLNTEQSQKKVIPQKKNFVNNKANNRGGKVGARAPRGRANRGGKK